MTPSDHIQHYASLIQKSIATKNLGHGKLLHSLLIKTALNLNVFLSNRLIDMYARCSDCIKPAVHAFRDIPAKNPHSYNTLISSYCKSGLFDEARRLFDEMPERNIVSYNTMISGLTHHGRHQEAIAFFREIHWQSDLPVIDKFTLVNVANACACLAAAELLRQVHAVVIVIGLELNLIMYNALVDAYGKCRDADASRRLFDLMPMKDVVSWTSMVVAYAREGRLEEACFIFDLMPVRNSVSWTALIAGHVQNGCGEKALEIFEQMQEAGIPPTAFTFVSVLNACTNLALIERGKQIHGRILRSLMGVELFNVFVYNALIDMYAKCGDMNSAVTLFERMQERDIVTWNSIVTGFAQNGCPKQSLSAFERMVDAGIRPNHVTFLGALAACSHTGLVSEGRTILDSMEKNFNVCPRPEHYAILIDALGRNNQLEEAMQLMRSAPCGSNNIGMWGSLLGACHIHGNLDLARMAAESLFDLDPENAARYVMLSNIYAAAGRWNDARAVRGVMKEKRLQKDPGYSWIEVRNVRHQFVSDDRSHNWTQEIYKMLAKLVDQMKEAGYQPSYSRQHFPSEHDENFDME
ncbi:hypothetical protein ACLOJK_016789 [Asimina triloba]